MELTMTTIKQPIMKTTAALAFVALAMNPHLAQAFTGGYQGAGNGVDLSGQITQIANQTSGMPSLIAWMGYIIGTAFVAFGIFKLKAHADNAAQNKLGPALGMLFTGAAFLVMPGAASLLIKTQSLNSTASIGYTTNAFQ
jgi:hypothetical protein